jgi:hypothetical protein
MLAGMLSVKLTNPDVGAVPILLRLTGRLLVRATIRFGLGWPIAMIRSGATTGVVTVVIAVLLLGLPSLATATVAESCGLVPAAAGRGVMGTCTVVLAPLVMVAEELQITSVPEVTQPKPLLVNEAGTVTLAGTLSVKLTSPEVGAVPMLLIDIGTILVCPTTSAGDAWPIRIVRSGAATGPTVVVAVLLFRLLSLAVATVAEIVGLVPVEAARGVMGTWTVVLAPLVIVAEELQDTNVPEVAQVKPLLVKLAEAVTLAGIIRVKLTGPDVATGPILLIVTGRLLGWPTSRPGVGWPMAIVRSGPNTVTVAVVVVQTTGVAMVQIW